MKYKRVLFKVIVISIIINIFSLTSVQALTDLQKKACDLNGDGVIDDRDVDLMLRIGYPEQVKNGVENSSDSYYSFIDLVGQNTSFSDTSSGFVGNTLEERVWWAIVNNGFSKEQAAGVLGNIYYESGFDANLEKKDEKKDDKKDDKNDDKNDDKKRFGLCQWFGERRKKLEEYCKSKGVPLSDENAQIEFLLGEIGVSDSASGFAVNGFSSKGKKAWAKVKTPEEAGKLFAKYLEQLESKDYSEREKKAKEYYDKYKDLSYSGNFGGNGSFVEENGNAKIYGYYTTSYTGTKRTYTIYHQSDSFFHDQCNRAAASSIASGYKKMSPSEAVSKANVGGILSDAGVTKNYFKKFDLTVKFPLPKKSVKCATKKSDIITSLNNKEFVAIHIIGNSVKGKSGNSWTSGAGMHWIAFLDCKVVNGKYAVFVSDSAFGGSKKDPYGLGKGWYYLDEFDNLTIDYITTVKGN